MHLLAFLSKLPLECQILVFDSSFEMDFSQLDSPHEDTERAGNDVLSGNVIGTKPREGEMQGTCDYGPLEYKTHQKRDSISCS